MTVFLRHLDEGPNPSQERWFPYSSVEDAERQAKHDLARGLPVEGVYAEASNDSKKLRTRSKLR